MGQLFVAVGPPEDDDIEYVEANAREVSAWLHSATSEQRREVAFALSVRSDTASRDLSMDLEGYSKDGVGVWLHAHPAEAVEIVRGLKVAGAWEFYPHGDNQYWYRTFYDVSHIYSVDHIWDAQAKRYTDRWRMSPDFSSLPRGHFGTDAEEAKSAADAALRAAGWSLA